jgi:hypothetical protein
MVLDQTLYFTTVVLNNANSLIETQQSSVLSVQRDAVGEKIDLDEYEMSKNPTQSVTYIELASHLIYLLNIEGCKRRRRIHYIQYEDS